MIWPKQELRRSGETIEEAAHALAGYANTFEPVPQDWVLNGDKNTDGLLTSREDLTPEQHADHVTEWLDAGATVVGGCCGTRPAHTSKMRKVVDKFMIS